MSVKAFSFNSIFSRVLSIGIWLTVGWSQMLNKLQAIALLALRLYLVPPLLQAGVTKMQHFADTVAWFGPDGLNLPMPYLLTILAISAEIGGAIGLLIGFATRFSAALLAVTMGVAIVTVHWQHGWLAVADASSWLANGTILYDQSVMASGEKLARAKELLAEHGNYDWLTASGSFVILNNGIEFAATYLVMLLVLCSQGCGAYFGLDYWIKQYCQRRGLLNNSAR
jgi:uncharacterized membrane protein YphA (DoxX/SURF4 family)